MERFIAQGNIDRFEQQLAQTTDPKRRQVLQSLLEAEKAKLAALSPGHAPTPPQHPTSLTPSWTDGDRGR